MKYSLYCFPNLEMGDNIVCNGMARFFATREKSIVWVARATYVTAIRQMFADLPNLEVIDGYDYPEIRKNIIDKVRARKVLMGFHGPEGPNWRTVQWDQEFYAQAFVDFEHRWKSFSLPMSLRPSPSVIDQKSFALVHDIPERGLRIDPIKLPINMPIVRITRTGGFWDWISFIYAAAELHFVDSAYLNLAESLYAMGYLRDCKLVFHSYPKIKLHNSVPPVLRAPWVVL